VLLPWHRAARLEPGPDGLVPLATWERELEARDVSLVVLTQVSNVTGARADVPAVVDLARRVGAAVAVDAAQSAPHEPIDVGRLGCDFVAFSGHKLGGPTGIGVLYGRAEALAELDWYVRGGQTVEEVHRDRLVAKPPPWRFEAGTPPLEAAVGLSAAMDFLDALSLRVVADHHRRLVELALSRLGAVVPQARIVGPTDRRRGPVAFFIPGFSPHTIARALSDGYGICVRSGFHCAQPLHEALGVPATLRASFFVYTTAEEIERFVAGVAEIVSLHRFA
jgi:cysteine desulfurase/selenocysteine lyase